MFFKIKSWKLTVLAIVCIALLTALGCWQWSRAHEKELLLKSFAERTKHAPLTLQTEHGDLRFYRAQLTGHFDNAHTILLDNKIYEGKVGYEVYTPFIANGLAQPVLVDRGFISIGTSRRDLPPIREITGEKTITGMLNLPPKYVALGKLADASTWPLRVEYIQLTALGKHLPYSLYPFVLVITPSDPAAYAVTWEVVIMSPERHRGYAVQWFALALTLLVIFVTLNRR